MRKITAILLLCASLPASASGLYAGAQIGTSIIKGDLASINTANKVNFFSYGAFAGYQLDLSSFFVAAEADFIWHESSMKSKHPEYEKHDILGISGILGAPVTQRIDVYGRIGQVRSQFKLRDTTNSVSFSQNKNGVSAGLGGRLHFDEKVSVRVDYRYNRFDQPRFSGYTTDKKAKEHLLNVGLQYQF